jgi:hypothetical protein
MTNVVSKASCRVIQGRLLPRKRKKEVDKLTGLWYNVWTHFNERGDPICSMEAGVRIGFFVSLFAVTGGLVGAVQAQLRVF